MLDGRMILVSENRLFRDGIRQMLKGSHITVVGEGCRIPELFEAVGTDAQPELVILHLGSGEASDSPLAAVRDLHAHFAHAKLVILADQSSRPMLPGLVHAGVSAILSTEISSELLELSLELVLCDHRLFPADIMPAVTGNLGAADATSPAIALAAEGDATAPFVPSGALPPDAAPAPPLSRREHEVVQCLAIGLSNKTIARRLNITEGTVKVHVKGLLRKLRVANRTQLAIWALRQMQAGGGDGGFGLRAEAPRAA
jgi:two-component system, NarL family, nitrate/nitrite response regulator NarL